MNLSKKIKWLTAVSVLAVGIPAAGIAFANPTQHLNTTSPLAVTQQAGQSAAPAAGTAQQPQGTANIHNPADSQEQATVPTTAPADSTQTQTPAQSPAPAGNTQQAQAPAPAVTISTSPAQNPAHNTHMNASQQSAPAPAPAPTPQVKPAPANSATSHGYHNGHTGPNDNMSPGNNNSAYGGEHGEHGTGGHE